MHDDPNFNSNTAKRRIFHEIHNDDYKFARNDMLNL